MSDTTHEAPERIWVEFEPRDWPTERIMYGEMGQPYEPYVRADLVQAAVAAALREAAEKTALMPISIPANPRLAYQAALDAVEQHILALITPDAQAALDRAIAAAIRKGGE